MQKNYKNYPLIIWSSFLVGIFQLIYNLIVLRGDDIASMTAIVPSLFEGFFITFFILLILNNFFKYNIVKNQMSILISGLVVSGISTLFLLAVYMSPSPIISLFLLKTIMVFSSINIVKYFNQK